MGTMWMCLLRVSSAITTVLLNINDNRLEVRTQFVALLDSSIATKRASTSYIEPERPIIGTSGAA